MLFPIREQEEKNYAKTKKRDTGVRKTGSDR